MVALLPVAAAELLLLVATANRYGYHRDELYFRVAARHPAWGYDDQPALTPLLGRFSEWAFGADPRGLRVVSAVAVALVVVLVALIARELGAGRTGQAVAALATAASGAAMAVGHLLSTTTFDVLVWVTVVLLVARILGGGDARQWLLVGLVAGIGLENKHLVLLLIAALACGCLLDRRFVPARSPWLWAGVVLALALWLPNLIWQAQHGWPQLELGGEISREDPVGNRVLLLPMQLLLIGPLLAPLWIGGLWWLLRGQDAKPYRPLGLAYVALLAIALVTGGKPYYTMGLLLTLLGAGGVVAERSLQSGRHGRLALGLMIGVSAAIAAAIVLPLVPVEDVHATPIPAVNEDAIETIGWPAFAATVAVRAESSCRRPNGRVLSCSRATTGRQARSPATAPRWASRAPTRGTTPSGASAGRPTAHGRSSWSATTIPHRSATASGTVCSPPGSTTASTSTTRSKAPRSGRAQRPLRPGRGSGRGCGLSIRDAVDPRRRRDPSL